MRKTGQSSFHQEKTILANKCRMCIPLLHLRYVELGDACEIIQRFVGRKLLTNIFRIQCGTECHIQIDGTGPSILYLYLCVLGLNEEGEVNSLGVGEGEGEESTV